MTDTAIRIVFALYVTCCYLALVLGSVFLSKVCFKTLTADRKNLDELIKAGIVRRTERKKRPNSVCELLNCGNSTFSSHYPRYYLLALPGLGLGVFIFVLGFVIGPSFLRGALVLFLFAASCITAEVLSNRSAGLRGVPTISILLIAFFYGALFWWIDVGFNPSGFDKAVEAAQGNMQKVTFLYSFVKDELTLVITLFGGICITLVWSISTTIKDQYAKAGIAGHLTGWAIWVDFWGSLGVLGWWGAEFGRELVGILNIVKGVP